MQDYGKEFDLKMSEGSYSRNKAKIAELEEFLNSIQTFKYDSISDIKGHIHTRIEEMEKSNAMHKKELREAGINV